MGRLRIGGSIARAVLCAIVMSGATWGVSHEEAAASESFVIAASPSLRGLLERLADGFEQSHPDVRVKLYFDSGLDLRRTIAGMENSMVGQYFIGRGPINLVAPGGDEVITRLEGKYYVLPDSRRPYAKDQLVMVVPESLVDAPDSLEAISRGTMRLAVADPKRTKLGTQTGDALRAFGTDAAFNARMDVATDWHGVVDHVLGGQADVGIIYGNQAVAEANRLRVTAVLSQGYVPTLHSMAMERYCPNRALCEAFLAYIQSAEGQRIVRQAGYATVADVKK